MVVSIANREDPDWTASSDDLGLRCLTRFYWQSNSVRNFKTLTIFIYFIRNYCICLPS